MKTLILLALCATSACAKPAADYLVCMDQQTEMLAWTSREPTSGELTKKLFAAADAKCGADRQGIASDISAMGGPGFSDGFYSAIYIHFSLRVYRLLLARKEML